METIILYEKVFGIKLLFEHEVVVPVSLYLLPGCLGFHYVDSALKPHRRPLFRTGISFQIVISLESTIRTGRVRVGSGRFLRLEFVTFGRG